MLTSGDQCVTVPIMIIGVDNDLGNLNVEGRTNARQVD